MKISTSENPRDPLQNPRGKQALRIGMGCKVQTAAITLKTAVERCVQAARLIGGRALMVNALDHEAAQFWQRRGFIASKDDPWVLLRSMADIAAMLAQEGGEV